jgi:hypothetical protein
MGPTNNNSLTIYGGQSLAKNALSVLIEDENGNIYDTPNTTVSVSMYSPQGAQLLGNTVVTPISGVATFYNLSVPLASTGNFLVFSHFVLFRRTSLQPVQSVAFDVMAGAASEITLFTDFLVGVMTSVLLVRDRFGALVVSDSFTSITISNAAAAGTQRRLLQTTQFTVTNGMVILPTTVGCLEITIAVVPPLPLQCPGPAAKLVVTSQPTSFIGGEVFVLQPVVVVVDGNDTRRMLDTRVVTASLVFVSGRLVQGVRPWRATAVGGAAAFTGIVIPDTVKDTVLFVFTSTGVSSVSSNALQRLNTEKPEDTVAVSGVYIALVVIVILVCAILVFGGNRVVNSRRDETQQGKHRMSSRAPGQLSLNTAAMLRKAP